MSGYYGSNYDLDLAPSVPATHPTTLVETGADVVRYPTQAVFYVGSPLPRHWSRATFSVGPLLTLIRPSILVATGANDACHPARANFSEGPPLPLTIPLFPQPLLKLCARCRLLPLSVPSSKSMCTLLVSSSFRAHDPSFGTGCVWCRCPVPPCPRRLLRWSIVVPHHTSNT